MKQACLYLFPTPISDGDLAESLPEYNKEALNLCKDFIVENIRTSRRFLRRSDYKHSLDEVNYYELNKHSKEEDIVGYLRPIEEGRNLGLMSEAGLPCIADPGAIIVRMAQDKGIRVVPLVGPSSIMMALMASGFNGQSFAFLGYIPIEKRDRSERIREIEKTMLRDNQTQIFIEAPYRNNQLLEALINNLKPSTRICIASDILLDSEEIITRYAKDWKKNKPDLHKRNTVFLIYK